MFISLDPIQTTFKHDDIQIVYESTNDYYKVVANKIIRKDTVILVEHCCCNDNLNDEMFSNISSNEILFNELYPRNGQIWKQDYLLECNNEITELVYDKIKKNCFGDSKKYVLGLTVSKFNHSNNNNAVALFRNIHLNLHDYKSDFIHNNNYTSMCFVIAVKDINIGDEIFISYGKNLIFTNSGKNLFFTKNGKNLIFTESNEEPTEIFNNTISEPFDEKKYHMYYALVMDRELRKHSMTENFLNICVKQISYNHGLYMIGNNTYLTEKFINYYDTICVRKNSDVSDYIDTVYNKNNTERISKWINYLYDVVSNYHRIYFIKYCVLIPSHIRYDGQLELFKNAIESICNQKTFSKILYDPNIYISISCENKYDKDVLQFINSYKNCENIYFNIEKQQCFQMEHLFKLANIIKKKYYDLVFFCDDDDTYDKKRILKFLLKYVKKLNSGFDVNGIRESIEPEDVYSKTMDYYAYAVKPYILFDFFILFKNDMNLFKNLYCDQYLKLFLRKNSKHNNWLDITNKKPYYNSNWNNENGIINASFYKSNA